MSISESDIQLFRDAWERLADLIRDLAEKWREKWRELIGEIEEKVELPTSKSYKLIKKLSKVTGIDQKALWKKTRIYRIRSNC